MITIRITKCFTNVSSAFNLIENHFPLSTWIHPHVFNKSTFPNYNKKEKLRVGDFVRIHLPPNEQKRLSLHEVRDLTYNLHSDFSLSILGHSFLRTSSVIRASLLLHFIRRNSLFTKEKMMKNGGYFVLLEFGKHTSVDKCHCIMFKLRKLLVFDMYSTQHNSY